MLVGGRDSRFGGPEVALNWLFPYPILSPGGHMLVGGRDALVPEPSSSRSSKYLRRLLRSFTLATTPLPAMMCVIGLSRNFSNAFE
jgi:hypothetical protein